MQCIGPGSLSQSAAEVARIRVQIPESNFKWLERICCNGIICYVEVNTKSYVLVPISLICASSRLLTPVGFTGPSQSRSTAAQPPLYRASALIDHYYEPDLRFMGFVDLS